MKQIYLLIALSFSLFIGCSTKYITKDFDSKENFYKHFNEHARSKDLSIKLKTDTILSTTSGAEIKNDTLLFDIMKSKKEKAEITLNKINHIAYKNSANTSAHLSLKNGKELDVEEMMFKQKSLICLIKNKQTINNYISLDLIENVSYKNHIQGTVNGVLFGLAAGVLLTVSKIIPANAQEGIPPYPKDYDYVKVGLFSIPLGILIGGVVGGLIGNNYTYDFNP